MELTPIDTDPDPTETYTILPLAGKGYGVIATQPIPSGTVIFQEPAYLKIPVPAISLTEKTLTTAFAEQSQESKDAILALHEGTAPDASSLMRIFKANNFGNSTSCWLHPRISRINHSCIPNAQIVSDVCCLGDVAQVVAEKDIEPGDEITFSYNHELYEITTSRQRAVLLRKQYGFACDCEACDGNDEAFRQRSDARRLLIKKLREILHGVETSDFSRFEKIDPLGRAMDDVTEDMFWMRESDLYRKRLPTWKKTAFTLLLAGLRDAEGLSATSIAGDYWHAAQYMLEQIQEMDDIVILPWAENVRSWMEKAIEVVERVYSPYDHDPQKLRAEWKAMQGKPCMQVAFAFLNGKLKDPTKASEGLGDAAPFAIQLTQAQELLLLSQGRCNATFEERDGDCSPVSQEEGKSPLKQILVGKSPNGWRRKLRDSGALYKVGGAALTCAAPVAAYWWYK